MGTTSSTYLLQAQALLAANPDRFRESAARSLTPSLLPPPPPSRAQRTRSRQLTLPFRPTIAR